MRRPPSLRGKAAASAYFCSGWELRITQRCLVEDLNASPEATFEEVRGLEIVRAFVRERTDRTKGNRQISPLTCGCEVWVIAHQHHHRGATWYDEHEDVVWLLAYGRHRSGEDDDFFPFCRALDAEDQLLPTVDDRELMLRERDRRFVEAVRVEAPVILAQARASPGEHQHLLGGDVNAGIAVEVDEDLGAEAITIAFRLDAIDWDYVPIMLAAFSDGDWQPIHRMPSRDLEAGEVAMTVTLP
jgi:hypothetical protein